MSTLSAPAIATPTVADVIASRLAEAGCRLAFGVPGGEVLTLIDALERAGIAFVLTRHETAAGFMAEGAWHATGMPGVLVATVGPGVANCVNPVANAQQDRVPLVLLTGAIEPVERAQFTHQVFDHVAVMKPLVKAAIEVRIGATAALVEKAVAAALAHPPGPVHLDIGTVTAASVDMAPAARRPMPARARPVAPDLAEARAAVAGARRPILILGLEVLTHGAADAVATFAERVRWPVVTTYKAKGVVPEDRPHALGGAGISPKADRLILPLIQAADLVLAVGYDPIEMRAGWCHPFVDGQTVVEIAGFQADHGMHRADHLLVGDIAATLAALTDGLDLAPGWVGDDRPAAARAALRQAFAAPETWGPHRAIATARRVLPRETLVTVDAGAHRILFSQMWESHLPRRILQSTGLCTMAGAVPLAMGYARACDPATRPPVVAFLGDGGMEMGMGDLATLRDMRLPVIVVVLNDASLALIEMKQRNMQLPNVGVDFAGTTDFAQVARAFGGVGETVTDAAGMERALTAALARTDVFTLIDARIDRRAYDGAL
jgi:acetolactate synthase-1/2/3 large subunit